jgi:outer membrane protein assembly factor BamD
VKGIDLDMHRIPWKLAIFALALAAVGCRAGFQLKNYSNNEALFQAALREFERGKWDNAAAGFEKLTLELAPRDTLAVRSFWYLGMSRQQQRDFLRAAQAFQRIFESYPDDSLAERALFQEGRSYQALWTRPDRDASYGDAALATYSSIATYYPDSKYKDSVLAQVKVLEAMFAEKHYETGMYYFRDKAFDSANLSFRRVLTDWPDAPRAREAALRLIESYRAIGYREEIAEICDTIRPKYDNDAEVAKACPPPMAAAAKPPTVGDTITLR